MQASAPDAPAHHERVIRKVATISMIGASIEWYDFFLYGAAAAFVFPKVFFAGDLPPFVGLLAAFATFAVGFLARPIGGIVFGHYGDKIGRKTTLVTALVLMGVSTTLIGLLPGYTMIGAWAPAALIILRFAQGFAVGGQWGGAMLLVTESAPDHKRGFYGCFAQAGVPVGVVLANLALLAMSSLLQPEEFMAWGWRVPFLFSVVLVGVALYIQLRLEETEAFRSLKAVSDARTAAEGLASVKRSPILKALVKYPKEIILAAGSYLCVQIGFYILIAFVIAYGANRPGLSISSNTMLLATLIGSVALLVALFVGGIISDRYGRRGIYKIGALLTGLWAFAIFPLIDTGSFIAIVAATSVAQLLLGLMYGPQAALFAELFSTEVRYSGATLSYQSGAILGGALAPLIATALLAHFGNGFAISVYIAVASLISFICISLLPETYKRGLST